MQGRRLKFYLVGGGLLHEGGGTKTGAEGRRSEVGDPKKESRKKERERLNESTIGAG